MPHNYLATYVCMHTALPTYINISRCTCPTCRCRLWHVTYDCAFGALACEKGQVAHNRAFGALLATYTWQLLRLYL